MDLGLPEFARVVVPDETAGLGIRLAEGLDFLVRHGLVLVHHHGPGDVVGPVQAVVGVDGEALALEHVAHAAAAGEGIDHCLHAFGNLLPDPIQQLALVPDVLDHALGRASALGGQLGKEGGFDGQERHSRPREFMSSRIRSPVREGMSSRGHQMSSLKRGIYASILVLSFSEWKTTPLHATLIWSSAGRQNC